MKKIYLNILTVLAISGLTAFQALAVSSYILRNNYGAPVEYSEQDVKNAAKYTQLIKRLDNRGKEVYVGTTYGDILSLRKVGGSFQDVSWIFEKINAQQQYYPNGTPVITINSYPNPLFPLS